MQDFVYQSAPMRVVFGTGTLRQLPDELSRLGVTRALMLATPRQNDLVAGIREMIGERFAGVDGGEIEDVTDFHLMREFIDRVFRKYLTPRERKILHLYYGLEQGSDAMTLEKIGALMGVTRERIRQIRERAFEKLRESADGAALAGFWS